MKSIAKQALVSAIVLVMAAPAIAGEINKGTKSYQTRADKADQVAAAEAPSADDVANIAPAAGASDEQVKEKSFKEELRLPRKN